MSDLIDRQSALDIYDDYNIAVENGELESYRRYRKQMLELPSAQPERKSGEWIIADIQNEEDEQNGNYRYICSCCGYSDIHSKAVRVPYCWHCGADMRGEKNG